MDTKIEYNNTLLIMSLHFTTENKYSDITIVSSEGIKFYYSKFLIDAQGPQYLKNMLLGPFAEGNEKVVRTQIPALILEIIFMDHIKGIHNIPPDVVDPLIEFCQMACWHSILRSYFDDKTVDLLVNHAFKIINMYPKILSIDNALCKKLREYVKTDTHDINPKIFKFYGGMSLLRDYLAANDTFNNSMAIYYYAKYKHQDKYPYDMLKLIASIHDDDLALKCLNEVRKKY